MALQLPDKLYFKIGEVSNIIGVKPYVLRYWESEFELLKPGKAPSRHRLYKKKDVDLLMEIKKLLYSEGYTIEGARKKLKEGKKEDRRFGWTFRIGDRVIQTDVNSDYPSWTRPIKARC